jgi:hypothetical protein
MISLLALLAETLVAYLLVVLALRALLDSASAFSPIGNW